MELSRLIESRVHRCLRHMARFKRFADDDSDRIFPNTPILDHERLLGVYENHPGQMEEMVVVTDLGLHIYASGGWSSAHYANMKRVVPFLPDGKRSVETLFVELGSGTLYGVPVSGGTERTRDAWGFLRLLNRVIADTEKRIGYSGK